MKKVVALIAALLFAVTCVGQIEITLKKDFIDQYADRVSVDSHFRVDVTSKIHPASQDGDIHVAGTAPEIGMLAVAEVMNAKTEKNSAVAKLVSAAGTNTPVPITGAWRIWSEHGGEQGYVQGEPVPVVENSGEAHVFEIHPITMVAGEDVTHTWTPTAGYAYKDADSAFTIYERTKCHILDEGTTVRISTEKAGYNYTEFVANLRLDPIHVDGGISVLAGIYDLNGELLVKERRLVMASGTEPEKLIGKLHKGDSIQVVGIPRLSLKLLKWRLEHHTGKYSQSLSWNIPYELIVAAVTDPEPTSVPD